MIKKIQKSSIVVLLCFWVAVVLANANLNQTEKVGKHSSVMVNDRTVDYNYESATKKEKFNLCLGMLKNYYNALDSRVEKSFALLIIVIGWIITSETARKTLAEETVWFWAAIFTLTSAVLFLGINISHFLDRFREIQSTIEQLNYVDYKYFTRYRMPQNILPSYLAPVIILYVFIMLLLFHLRFKIFSFLSIFRTKDGSNH